MTELDKAPDDLLKDDAWRTTKLRLRRIPAGKFVMGTPAGDAAGEQYFREYHGEDKPHTVTLTKDVRQRQPVVPGRARPLRRRRGRPRRP